MIQSQDDNQPTNVLIYRDLLLPYSETFIKNQVISLTKYRGIYAGTLTNKSHPDLLEAEQVISLDRIVQFSLPWRLLFKFFGMVHPDWIRAIRQQSPVLLHAHFGPDAVWAMPLARQLKLPLLITFHGYDATLSEGLSAFTNRLYGLYLKRRNSLFNQAQGVIAVSKFVQSQLEAKGCPPDKIYQHYIGIDTAYFCPDRQQQRSPIILFVGRLVEKKGCFPLIQAIARVQQVTPDIELILIGDGSLRSALETEATAHLKRYQFLGQQPPSTVRDWMNRAKVLCVPSQQAASGDTEGLGMVFLEAQAMGLPVVSCRSGGIPEAVVHGETGFLVPEGDVNGLAQHIVRLVEDAPLWQRLSHQGRAWVCDRFDLQTQTRKLEAIYDTVLAEHQRKRLGSRC
ncbi:Glycosyltransferase Type 1 [Halomicronema hongdechloris C2206]|uniref:Glycosyltransferase Type 1 n=1 Tax=Halomicronema hongdechloris C2206 TaxID=1641165 RepID=A0A1Z3HMB8_9CYAN|nr:glycosyltransferase [Halomicronema hongdechloris]ASC71444.1 Glycosyltransferase Type 1 [Halomicronema hongdechloris C2206]